MSVDDPSGIVQSVTEVVSTAGTAFKWVMNALLGLNFLAIVVTILAITERVGATEFPVIPTAPEWGVFVLVGLFLTFGVLSVIGMVGGMVASGAEAMETLDEYR